MYSIKTATVNNEEFSSSYMPVGINNNITLKECTVEKSPTGKDFIRFIFEDKEGRSVNTSEWKNEKNMWIKTDEDLQKRDDTQFGRILQIVGCYYNELEDVSFTNFSEMINWVKSKLDPMIPTKKELRLKTIYDKNGFVTISRNGLFIEPMTVTDSQIKLFKNDLLERPIVADKESDPLTGNSIPADGNKTGADDLPF